MNFPFTFQEFLIAAALALVVTWAVKIISTLFIAVVTHSTEIEFTRNNKDDVLERCYEMFPHDNVSFNGENFHRGMYVCVVTLRRKRYEGRLIGINQNNMVCVMTDRSVVAQELDTIKDIWEI